MAVTLRSLLWFFLSNVFVSLSLGLSLFEAGNQKIIDSHPVKQGSAVEASILMLNLEKIQMKCLSLNVYRL